MHFCNLQCIEINVIYIYTYISILAIYIFYVHIYVYISVRSLVSDPLGLFCIIFTDFHQGLQYLLSSPALIKSKKFDFIPGVQLGYSSDICLVCDRIFDSYALGFLPGMRTDICLVCGRLFYWISGILLSRISGQASTTMFFFCLVIFVNIILLLLN